VAFKAAKQYAPAGTKLFINDYSTTDANRQACLIQVVKELKQRGVPVDAIGHEMHNSINYPSPDAVKQTIEAVAKHFPGITQQVTELDVSVYNAGDTAANYGNSIPASVLAEQGWLYDKYFKVFRELKDKLSAVTIWGMADDDTWLDSFPVVRTDYPLPFDMQLQAKPAYWGIVDPKKLPGHGLRFSVASTKGVKGTRVFTLTATNGDVGPAYATEITGFTLKQVLGRRCSPVVSAPSSGYPVLLGDIPTSGAASTTIEVSFAGCDSDALFTLNVPWSSSTYHTGTLEAPVVLIKDHGWVW
jgi:endo-1,4-beta-xylanase